MNILSPALSSPTYLSIWDLKSFIDRSDSRLELVRRHMILTFYSSVGLLRTSNGLSLRESHLLIRSSREVTLSFIRILPIYFCMVFSPTPLMPLMLSEPSPRMIFL
jgi:hypothetical protein